MQKLLNAAIAGALKAGEAIIELYEVTDFDEKSDGSPVTVADMRSNEILHAHLKKTGIAILSEESEGIPLPYPDELWIIDPLDGTKDFIHKNGDFAVMVGLIRNGRPVLGVVYAPAYDTLYFAMEGGGAFVREDGVDYPLTMAVDAATPLRCIRSMNHFSKNMADVAEKLGATLHPRGSLGVKAGVLVENEGDYFSSRGKFGEWDVCAPEIIVKEAGGRVTDCSGDALFYGTPDHRLEHGIIFANAGCYDRVLEAVRGTAVDKEHTEVRP